MRKINALFTVMTVIFIVSGCSTTKTLTPATVEKVEYKGKADPETLKSIGVGTTIGLGTGAAAGAVAGGLIGLGCGPLAIICSPTIAIFGAGVGAASGAIIGGGSGYIYADTHKPIGIYKFSVKGDDGKCYQFEQIISQEYCKGDRVTMYEDQQKNEDGKPIAIYHMAPLDSPVK